MNVKAAAPTSPPLTMQSMARGLNICRFNRLHERYHSGEGLRIATELRKNANALKILAERWGETPAITPDKDHVAPLYQALGCEDLNDPAGITATGMLFMEGESDPRAGLVDGHWTRVIEGLTRRGKGALQGASGSASPSGE